MPSLLQRFLSHYCQVYDRNLFSSVFKFRWFVTLNFVVDKVDSSSLWLIPVE